MLSTLLLLGFSSHVLAVAPQNVTNSVWTVQTYPNPCLNNDSCINYICDPDKVLSDQSQDRLREELKQVNDEFGLGQFYFYVLLARDIQGGESAINTFTRGLYSRFTHECSQAGTEPASVLLVVKAKSHKYSHAASSMYARSTDMYDFDLALGIEYQPIDPFSDNDDIDKYLQGLLEKLRAALTNFDNTTEQTVAPTNTLEVRKHVKTAGLAMPTILGISGGSAVVVVVVVVLAILYCTTKLQHSTKKGKGDRSQRVQH